MATYKLIQDIEAEDHILGPLTLRQFIYGLVAALFFYLSFLVISKHVAFFLVLFLPPGLMAAFLAFPFGKDQPTEIWALAKVRFLFKPRKRIWDQSGIKELITVTAPKKVEEHLTNGLSQVEVKSRLRALADTLDTRGWVIKNVGVGDATNLIVPGDADRLIDVPSMPKLVPDFDSMPEDDMLDVAQNPEIQKLNSMMNAYDVKHRQQLYDILNNNGLETGASKSSLPAAQPAENTNSRAEVDLSNKLKTAGKAGSLVSARMHTVSPHRTIQPVHTMNDPAILNLSRDNNLSVSTLSSEANKAKEVVIELHREK